MIKIFLVLLLSFENHVEHFEGTFGIVSGYLKLRYNANLRHIAIKSSNLDWPELEKHSLSHSFIITLKQSYDVFPNFCQSKLLDFDWNNTICPAFKIQKNQARLNRFQ